MTSYARRAGMGRGVVRALRSAGVRLALRVLQWHELAQQRHRLLTLDDRALKDIGLSRADAIREAGRPFWDGRDVDWTSWR